MNNANFKLKIKLLTMVITFFYGFSRAHKLFSEEKFSFLFINYRFVFPFLSQVQQKK